IWYVEVPRKRTRRRISEPAAIDETFICVVNDVRAAGFANRSVNPKMSRRQKELSPNLSHCWPQIRRGNPSRLALWIYAPYSKLAMDLFTPVVPEGELHPNFRALIGNFSPGDRAVLAEWADGFVDRDGKFVTEFQTTFN